jgi:hypothetical protein
MLVLLLNDNFFYIRLGGRLGSACQARRRCLKAGKRIFASRQVICFAGPSWPEEGPACGFRRGLSKTRMGGRWWIMPAPCSVFFGGEPINRAIFIKQLLFARSKNGFANFPTKFKFFLIFFESSLR